MNDPQRSRLTPLDEWETEAANILDGGDYDVELRLRMARDMIRVSNGELSDEVFREKYHEAIVAKFGEDTRPTESEEFGEWRRTRLDGRWRRR